MESNIRELQLVELNIMKKVLEIIDRHHLRYFMLGGTLLGAIRHKGFIPWDDDMDIGLPRPDYEIFLQVAEAELKGPYQLHTQQNGIGEYSYYYSRVEDSSVRLKRALTAKTVIIPAWIDVFPLDGVPETEKDFDRWCRRNKKYKLLFELSQFEYSFNIETTKQQNHQGAIILAKKIITKTKIYKLINQQVAWKALDRSLKSYNYEWSSRLINYCGYWGMKEMFPKSAYGEGKLYKFEDLRLMGPVDYDYVLTQMYGDYMTPLPEDKRDHHKIELIVDAN